MHESYTAGQEDYEMPAFANWLLPSKKLIFHSQRYILIHKSFATFCIHLLLNMVNNMRLVS